MNLFSVQATQITKAIKATIYLGTIPLDVYQMPDSSYKLYAESVTGTVNKHGRDLIRFLNGKSPLALPFKDYNLIHAKTVEVEGQGGFIKPIPVPLATSYWLFEACKGNVKAQAIAQASMIESVERRADKVFYLRRTETEYNQSFAETLESILTYNHKEVEARRLPGDDLYLPPGIN